MGAKVGRCVYWPGSGIIFTDPELLDIGNNVVFGFQSHLITTDRSGSEKIVIEDGGKFQFYSDFVIVLTVSVFIASAMVADRVVLLPGTRVGSAAVMGTGSLGKRNGDYAAGSVWIGNSRFSSFFKKGNEFLIGFSDYRKWRSYLLKQRLQRGS